MAITETHKGKLKVKSRAPEQNKNFSEPKMKQKHKQRARFKPQVWKKAERQMIQAFRITDSSPDMARPAGSLGVVTRLLRGS